ncbi:MAG: DUF3990 domain-containing protein [Prevotella sp.]|nr:DUF3990 domain-containing protein [Candidatus Equicola faecalis]
MKLYHGSNIEIDVIDLQRGRRGKDFGQGFYLSPDIQQAREMAETVVDREECGAPIVTIFEFDEHLLEEVGLDVKIFSHYSIEWSRFVRSNRKNKTSVPLHSHDIVYGPIADDTIAKQMRLLDLKYIDEAQFMKEIQYKKETFQYFFGTEKSISYLTKIGTL